MFGITNTLLIVYYLYLQLYKVAKKFEILFTVVPGWESPFVHHVMDSQDDQTNPVFATLPINTHSAIFYDLL